MPDGNPDAIDRVAQAYDHLRDGKPDDAKAIAARLVEQVPEDIDGWIVLGRAYMDLAEYDNASRAAERATAINAENVAALILKMDAAAKAGQYDEAMSVASKLEAGRTLDPVAQLHAARCFVRLNHHARALRCYERLRVLQPADRSCMREHAGALMAVGALDQAESLLDDLLRRNPQTYEAHYIRSTLRRQTTQRNHMDEMERVLAGVKPGDGGEGILCFAIAKELEDLEQWKRSFHFLKRGAVARKRDNGNVSDPDLPVIDIVRSQFDQTFFENPPAGYRDESPIFVLGLPRSGTTLVDRIISSHSAVVSAGETGQFARALAHEMLQGDANRTVDVGFIRALDYAAVGRRYCEAVRVLAPGEGRVLDKTPKNFTYVGLILTALPNAKIVHVRRQAMDACYAYYKTLFRDSEPMSYDFGDIARYYLAYRGVMEFWRRCLPDRFLDVDYEELVDHQEAVTRRMLEFCGLDWEAACLRFEDNRTPSLTASAAQVRQPMYRSSIGAWKHYEAELEPLAGILRAAGIPIA